MKILNIHLVILSLILLSLSQSFADNKLLDSPNMLSSSEAEYIHSHLVLKGIILESEAVKQNLEVDYYSLRETNSKVRDEDYAGCLQLQNQIDPKVLKELQEKRNRQIELDTKFFATSTDELLLNQQKQFIYHVYNVKYCKNLADIVRKSKSKQPIVIQ